MEMGDFSLVMTSALCNFPGLKLQDKHETKINLYRHMGQNGRMMFIVLQRKMRHVDLREI